MLIFREVRREMSGFEAHTTNNRMELTAAIEGLSALKEPCRVRLYSDSSYLINGFQKGWVWNWQRRDWIKSDKKPVRKSGSLEAADRTAKHAQGRMDQGARSCRQRRKQPLRHARDGTRSKRHGAAFKPSSCPFSSSSLVSRQHYVFGRAPAHVFSHGRVVPPVVLMSVCPSTSATK